ncbi:hypothetical protein SESBI_45788 [Sesbania bispinosa]|nr:hypothetical protein SESBI_45788 [Sesbania bispinosa]
MGKVQVVQLAPVMGGQKHSKALKQYGQKQLFQYNLHIKTCNVLPIKGTPISECEGGEEPILSQRKQGEIHYNPVDHKGNEEKIQKEEGSGLVLTSKTNSKGGFLHSQNNFLSYGHLQHNNQAVISTKSSNQ